MVNSTLKVNKITKAYKNYGCDCDINEIRLKLAPDFTRIVPNIFSTSNPFKVNNAKVIPHLLDVPFKLSRCSDYNLCDYSFTSTYKFKYFFYDQTKRVIRIETNTEKFYSPQILKNGIWHNIKADNWIPYIPYKSFTPGYCLIVEGENCVDSLVSRNWTALTFKTYSDLALEDAISHIIDKYDGFIIIPDNDFVGSSKAQLVRKKLWQAQQKADIIDINKMWIVNRHIQESEDIKDLLDNVGNIDLEKLLNLVV